MKYNTTALLFFTTKKRAHPLPYYLQELNDRLLNILMSITSTIESHPPPKGFKFQKKMRGLYFIKNHTYYCNQTKNLTKSLLI
jgi:hypothetical protein